MEQEDRFYKVHWFMTHELDLKGVEKDVYAIIYGFQDTYSQNFCGSAAYIAKWINATDRGVKKAIQSLKDKGLLLVIKKSATRNEYRALRPDIADGEFCSPKLGNTVHQIREHSSPTQKNTIREHSSPKLGNTVHQIRELSSPNNINKINKINNIYSRGKKSAKPTTKHKIEEPFIKPTIEEIQSYADEKGLKLDVYEFYDHYETVGWMCGRAPMKDWKAAVRIWVRRKEGWDKAKKTRAGSYNSFQQNTYDYDELEKDLKRN